MTLHPSTRGHLQALVVSLLLVLVTLSQVRGASISTIFPSSPGTAGEQNFKINGSAFGLRQPTGALVYTSSGTCRILIWTNNLITCTHPAGYNRAGSSQSLTMNIGTGAANLTAYSYDFAAPTIFRLSNSSGPAAGGVSIDVIGTNFFNSLSAVSVTLGSIRANVTFADFTKLTFTLPPGVGAGLTLQVTVGISTATTAFSYYSPSITGVTPAKVSTSGGPITIRGINFGSQLANVTTYLGPTQTTTTYVNNTAIVFTAPPGMGTGMQIRITVATQSSNTDYSYSYLPPNITSITPTAATTAGGVNITLTGTNFGITSTVTVGGFSCPVVFQSHTRLICTSPAFQGANLSVVVTAGAQSNTNFVYFSYLQPNITAVSPSRANSIGSVPITINGTNFGQSGSVTIGASVATSVTWANNQIVFTLPPGQGINLPIKVNVAGQVNPVNGFSVFSYNAPNITQPVSPPTGPTEGSGLITITGTSFGLSGTVTVGGVSCPVISNGYSHNQIICTLPSGTGINLPVVLNVSNQITNSTKNGFSFSYSAPKITTNPSPGSGDTTGGYAMSLTGSSFGLTRPNVTVGGRACNVTAFTSIGITCTVPAGESASQPVRVTTSLGASNVVYFDYNPPSVTSVSPPTVSTAGAVVITIFGQNLGTAAVDPVHINISITVNGRACPVVPSPARNHTQVACTVPAGQGLNNVVSLSLGSPTRTATGALNYVAPTVTRVFPASTTAGSGARITISGSNFGLTPSVTVANVPWTVLSSNHTTIVATAANGTGSSLPVVVTVAGQTSNNNVSFAYSGPSITNVIPAVGPTQGSIWVTVVGTSFGFTGRVTIGGSDCLPVRSQNDTAIICQLPAGQGLAKTVRFTVGTITSNDTSFSYSSPSINSTTPAVATGRTAGGDTLILRGQNFGTQGVVTVGASLCTSLFYNHTYISCTVPKGSGTNQSILVMVASQISNILPFNYLPPVISGVSPANGPTSGATVVAITGDNFGSSGVITINGQTCTTSGSSYSDTSIRCTTPAGQGLNLNVSITVAGQQNALNASSRFSYDNLTVTSVSSSGGRTMGGDTLVITGNNFGLTGQVKIGGQVCTLTGFGRTHTQIQVLTPAGQGTNLPISVSVDNGATTSQTSLGSPLLFSYSRPTITSSISVLTGLTTGLDSLGAPVKITMIGTNFGTSNATRQVSMGTSSNCSIVSANQTAIVFQMAAGTGASVPISVTIQGQSTSYTGASFAYSAPNITNITGCSSSGNPLLTVNCSVAGPVNLTVRGTSFGNNVSHITATVDGAPCTIVNFVAHTSITCQLATRPSGGFFLSVVVTVNTRSVTQALAVSYSGPTISSVTGFTNPVSVTGGSVVTINGAFLGTVAGNISVRYGLSGTFESKAYSCSPVTIVTSNARLTCPLSAGGGRNLFFQVTVGLQQSVQFTTTLTYAQPAIVGSTIRDTQSTPSTSLTGTSTQRNLVYFNVTNVAMSNPSFSYVQARLMSRSTGSIPCTSLTSYPLTNSSGTISCFTGAGTGSDYFFIVSALNYDSANGTDTFSYPQAPTVNSITADSTCTNAFPKVVDCPTVGGSIITISGAYFTSQSSIKIDSEDCLDVTYVSSNTMTCSLPPGTGLGRSILVSSTSTGAGAGTLFSSPKPYLSYHQPVIDSIEGCTNSGANTVDCPRNPASPVAVTITGTYFGASLVTVLIGGDPCDNPTLTVADTTVVCSIRSGVRLNQPVYLFQANGAISANSVLLSYLQCTPGTYSQGDALACTLCDAGKFSASAGLSLCADCPAGTYSAQGASACTECGAGTYSGAAASNCIDCTAGNYNPLPGQPSCLACPTGTFGNVTALSLCSDCPPGRFAGSSGLTSCQPCSSGNYAAASGAANCDLCPVGTISASNGASSCTDCDPGYKGPVAGSSSCLSCQPGSYSSTPRQGACTLCDAGTFSNDSALIICFDCPAGMYSEKISGNGPTSCTPSPVGSYIGSAGQATSALCPKGTYADTMGSTACTPCLTGTANTDEGRSSCGACQPGTYADVTGRVECASCPVGTYADSTNTIRCASCPTGSYQPITGKSACLACDPGTAQPSLGKVSCTACESGFYANQSGSVECNRCDAGYYSTKAGAVGPTVCTECGFGKYSGAVGQDRCNDCPVGFYSNALGSIVCKPCPPGTFAAATGLSQCQNCSAGSYAPSSGASQCIPCDVGTFSASDGASSCADCSLGQYQDKSRASSCLLCGPGTYSNVAGRPTCTPCPAGFYSNSSGSTFCSLCPPGTSQPDSEQKTCLPCDKGTYMASWGQAKCLECPQGTYGPGTYATACSSCPQGMYVDASGAQVCKACAEGRYAAVPGSVVCDSCPPGRASNNQGASVCDECSPGSFQDLSGQTSCQSCGMGRFINSYGEIACLPCPTGYYTATTGSSSCAPCAAGTFALNIGSQSCLPCEIGKFSASSGSVQCSDCPPGRYENETQSVECKPCAPGASQPSPGSSACAPCSLGTYSVSLAASSCSPCSVGTFASKQSSIKCNLCNPGSYADNEGSSQCMPCPLGSYMVAYGQPVCVECPAGTFASSYGATSCTPCPAGSYQDRIGSTDCSLCPQGTAAATGSASCSSCGAQSVAPNVGMAECIVCDRNSVPDLESIRCVCEKGYAFRVMSNDNTTQGQCVECPEGAVCEERGTMWDTMETRQGWWGSPQTSTYYRCLQLKDCEGGLNNTCGDNRAGTLCARCSDGYYEDITGTCSACPSSGASAGFFAFAVIAITAAVVGMYFVVIYSGRDLNALAREEMERKKRASMGFEEMLQDPNNEASRFMNYITLNGEPRPKPHFMFKLKIAIGFAQIIFNLTMSLETKWPADFKRFMSWFNPANLDLVRVSNVECVTSVNHYSRLLALSIIPVLFCSGLVLFYLTPKYLRNMKKPEERKVARRNFWKLLLFTLFLIYPAVSSTVLRTFVCKKVEGTNYLVADFSLTCDAAEWQKWAAFAGVMTVVYPFGIPAFMFAMMWRYRHRLDDPAVRDELGFLFDGYTRPFWWFEMLDMFHKLAVTSLIAFIPFDVQMPLSMAFVTAYTVTLLVLKPHLRKGDDRLHLFAQTEIFLILLSGHVFNNLSTPDATMDLVLSVILITVVLLLLAFFFFQGAKSLQKMWQVRKQDRVKEKVQGVDLPSPASLEMSRKYDEGSLPDTEDVPLHVRNASHKRLAQNYSPEVDIVRNPMWMKAPSTNTDTNQDEVTNSMTDIGAKLSTTSHPVVSSSDDISQPSAFPRAGDSTLDLLPRKYK